MSQGLSWRYGYLVVALIQFGLVAVLFLTLPMWRGRETRQLQAHKNKSEADVKLVQLLQMKKVRLALYAFFLYIGVEATMGLWTSSYLISVKGIASDQAAVAVSAFFGFIMFGRLLSGFVSMLLNNRQLIQVGQLFILFGSLLVWFSSSYAFLLLGISFIGFGCAPIYPAMLHETPQRFGQKIAQEIMGVQMAFSYTGSVILPPLFGFLVPIVGMRSLPIFLLFYGLMMWLASESLVKKLAQEKRKK